MKRVQSIAAMVGGIGITVFSLWLGPRIIRYIFKQTSPDFLQVKMTELESNPVLMDSIGGYINSQWTYNENDYNDGDTLRYSIQYWGGKRELLYQGIMVRENGEWTQYKDSVIIQ